jgi:uncharacterized protein YuzE
MVKASYDRKHDVAYVEFSAADSAQQVALDDARIIGCAADGSVVGVEFISPSRGVNLVDVPRAAEIEQEVRRLGLPIRMLPADGRRGGHDRRVGGLGHRDG